VPIELLSFAVAGIAMTAPEFPRLLTNWSGETIYPWWAALYIVAGMVASSVSVVRRDARWGPGVQVALAVVAAQIAGLGFVAVKHWQPSFGMGGGYAGRPEDLARLAWVIGVAGTVAALSALAQLVGWRVFSVRASIRGTLLFGGSGALIVLALPYGIAEGDPALQDVTSIGAFVLIYSGPVGLSVAGAAWLPERLRVWAVGSCAAAAGFSALDLITDLSYLRGRPALLGTAVSLAVFAAALGRLSRSNKLRPG
jgi:hypothetical protein